LKKLFVVCVTAVVVVAAVWCVALSYAFNIEGTAFASEKGQAAAFGYVVDAFTVMGVPVEPEAFLSGVPESEDVAVSFNRKADYSIPGIHEVSLFVEYGEESFVKKALLYVLEPARSVEYEAGSGRANVRPEDFILNLGILSDSLRLAPAFVTDIYGLDFDRVRRYEIELSIGGVKFKSFISLIDSTPPKARAFDVSIIAGQAVSAGDFISDIEDLSECAVYFAEGGAPDVFKTGSQKVAIVVEDLYGNASAFSADLHVARNESPPTITGAKNIAVMLGDTVRYRQGVAATDSFGNPLELTVDSSQVDTGVPGGYTVLYSAEDASGNKVSVSVEIEVGNVGEEQLMEIVDGILAGLIKDGMNQVEISRMIFNWVTNNISYISTAPDETVYDAAYRGLKGRAGDCFTSYAVSEVFLTRAGIENMRITRIEGTPTKHFWNLINPDGGGWFHFDTTRTRDVDIDKFMFGDSKIEEYNAIMYSVHRMRNYYAYDKEKYPVINP